MKNPIAVLLASLALAAAPLGAEVVLVTNTASTGPGSLKDALDIANADPTHTDVHFAIPSDYPEMPAILTIELSVPLPEITTPVTIDGSTQVSSRILLRNLTPFPTFELTFGSNGSKLRSIDVRRMGIELKAPDLTVDDCDFADIGGFGIGILIGNHEDVGDATHGLVIRNSRFTNVNVFADMVLQSVSVVGNTFTRAQFRTFSIGGQAMLDSTVENNTFDCVDLPVSAVEIKHPIRNVFRGNAFKNCAVGLALWSQTGADTVGHNLVEANVFEGGGVSIGIGGLRHAHNRITRNVSTGNTNEPVKLNGLTVATWGNPQKPNRGKGRPAVTNAYLSGPFFNRKVNLSGTTFLTTPTDTVEIFLTQGGFTHDPATDSLVLSPKRYLASVTASGGVWSAILDVGTYGLGGATSFTVTATDADNNTSELAVPLGLWVSGF
jgi:hypothetical protein